MVARRRGDAGVLERGRQLERMGFDALLKEAANDPDTDVRTRAATALEHLNAASSSALSMLLDIPDVS